LASERFDIIATLPAGTTGAQVPLMLQNLLADRFHVVTHHEKKEFPVSALWVAKEVRSLDRLPAPP